MWKMTNGLGKEVTWYSKEEMEEYAIQILKIHLKFLKQNGKLNRHVEFCFKRKEIEYEN